MDPVQRINTFALANKMTTFNYLYLKLCKEKWPLAWLSTLSLVRYKKSEKTAGALLQFTVLQLNTRDANISFTKTEFRIIKRTWLLVNSAWHWWWWCTAHPTEPLCLFCLSSSFLWPSVTAIGLCTRFSPEMKRLVVLAADGCRSQIQLLPPCIWKDRSLVFLHLWASFCNTPSLYLPLFRQEKPT